MKKFGLLFSILIVMLANVIKAQTIFYQDFSSSNMLADYIGTGIQQFDEITNSTGSSVALVSNALVLTRSTGGSARYSKVTDLSAATINGMVFMFDLSVSGNSVAQTTAATLNVGNGYSTGGTVTNATTFAKIGINLTTTNGTFALRDVTNGTNSANFSGTQTITWVMNTYTSGFTYLAPDNSTESIAANTWDLWVGTAKVFDDKTPQTSTIDNLTDFKFLYTAGAADITFDNFVVEGSDGNLPVELTSFSATTIGSTVKLNWNTATEVNNYGFDVERKSKVEGQTSEVWEKIGFVNGNGNSNSPRDYSFVDNKVNSGKFSYRLKQIDNDGQYEYSKTIEVDMNGVKKFELSQNYPNPFNPSTVISYELPVNGYVSLKVFDVLGNEIATLVNEEKPAGSYNVQFTINSVQLGSGVYFYRLQSGDYVEGRKMVVLK